MRLNTLALVSRALAGGVVLIAGLGEATAQPGTNRSAGPKPRVLPHGYATRADDLDGKQPSASSRIDVTLSAPLPATPPFDFRKNRRISFDPNNPATPVAIRIEVADLICSDSGNPCSYDADCWTCDGGQRVGRRCAGDSDCPGAACLDVETCLTQTGDDPGGGEADDDWEQIGWVGIPCEILENSFTPANTFSSLVVSEMPAVRIFPRVLHVNDCEIQPNRSYALRATTDGTTFSPRFLVATILAPTPRHWADVVGPIDPRTGSYTEPDGRVNVDDVAAVHCLYDGRSTCPHITVVSLTDEVPRYKIYSWDYSLVRRSFWFNGGCEGYPPEHFGQIASEHPRECPDDGGDAIHPQCSEPAGAPTCGDATVELGEECDDGGTVGGDGCGPNCRIERECGNGNLEPGEQCDDNNTNPGDGCDEGCQVESICGNGTRELGEECDDGNSTPGDGCDENCESEAEVLLEWVPVGSTGPFALAGNDIHILGGEAQVTFEIRLSGWGQAPGNPAVQAYNLTLDGSSLLGVNASPSNPGVDLQTPAQVECPDGDGDCPTGICGVFQGGRFREDYCDDNQAGFVLQKVCVNDPSQECFTGEHCPPGGFCIDNPEFLLAQLVAGSGVALPVDNNLEWIAETHLGEGKSDPGSGSKLYLGTLRLDVPADATGDYTIAFDADGEATFLNDTTGRRIPGLTFLPGTIRIGVDVPDPPLPAAPPFDVRKNRYISFRPDVPNLAPIAIRISDLERVCSVNGEHCSYDSDCPDGESCLDQRDPIAFGWIGEPCEVGPTPQVPEGTYTALVVHDMPALRVFTEPLIHLTDCEIMPVRTYALSATSDGLSFSEPLIIATILEPVKNAKKWADVVGHRDADTGDYTEPNQRLNVDDISVMIVFLNSKSYRPHITVLDLSHEVPNFKISADDLNMVIRAITITEGYPTFKWITEASGASVPWECPGDPADARHPKCQ